MSTGIRNIAAVLAVLVLSAGIVFLGGCKKSEAADPDAEAQQPQAIASPAAEAGAPCCAQAGVAQACAMESGKASSEGTACCAAEWCLMNYLSPYSAICEYLQQ